MLSTGSHWVSAYAYDAQGSRALLNWSSSGAGNFTVVTATGKPTGYLASAVNATNGSKTIPQNGTILVQGWAAESGNPVARAQVTIDGNVVGNASVSATSISWSFTYNIGMLSTGGHWVSAVGYDAQGSSAQLNWSSSNAGNSTVTTTGTASAVNHVVFMLQENRSFDNYFGMLNPYRKTSGF